MKKMMLVTVTITVLASSLLFSQEKPDALKLFRQGRDLEATGRTEDAKAVYAEAIEVCKLDLEQNDKNMDAYTVYGWALVRLGKYRDAVDISLAALKVSQDYRIIETAGEAFFYQGNHKDSLKYMERYIDAAPRGERISTAYFFVGEIYRLGKQYNKAEFAYSSAVYLEPALSLWWYRLGTVREAIGEKPAATEAYQRALKLRTDYKEALEGLNRVRT